MCLGFVVVVFFLLFRLPPGHKAAIPAGNPCFKRRTRWGERSGFPTPLDQSETSRPGRHTGFLPLPGSCRVSGLGVQLSLPPRMPCVLSATSGSPLYYYYYFFLNLKIIWWCSSWVICCHCNIRCMSDSHSRKPLFPFCQYLGICLAQEPADEDFLFVLSHCWSDKYTSALSSERKETSCPELKGKICRNSTKGPCYHEASMEGWNWVTGAMTKAWFPY